MDSSLRWRIASLSVVAVAVILLITSFLSPAGTEWNESRSLDSSPPSNKLQLNSSSGCSGPAEISSADWNVTFPNVSVSSMNETSQGYILAGCTEKGGVKEVWTAEVNRSGGVIWRHTSPGRALGNSSVAR